MYTNVYMLTNMYVLGALVRSESVECMGVGGDVKGLALDVTFRIHKAHSLRLNYIGAFCVTQGHSSGTSVPHSCMSLFSTH